MKFIFIFLISIITLNLTLSYFPSITEDDITTSFEKEEKENSSELELILSNTLRFLALPFLSFKLFFIKNHFNYRYLFSPKILRPPKN